ADEPEAPADEPEAPADEPEAPADEPEAPADEPEAPADEPEAPADEPEAPADEPEAPADEPEAPADEPEAPANEPEAPADEPEASADEPEAPADEPEAPADEPEAPADEPEAPADEPEAPADEPEAPADEPEAPADEPEAPADEPEAPAEEEQKIQIDKKISIGSRWNASISSGKELIAGLTVTKAETLHILAEGEDLYIRAAKEDKFTEDTKRRYADEEGKLDYTLKAEAEEYIIAVGMKDNHSGEFSLVILDDEAYQELKKQEETPEETPADETPAEETPAEETPAEETASAEEAPAADVPAEETPAGTPAEVTTPAEETPAAETPAAETPTEEDPAETPDEETPAAEETPVIKYPAFDQRKTVKDVTVRVRAEEGVFPEGAVLYVAAVQNQDQIEEVDAAVESERKGSKNVAVSYTFDIQVRDAQGNEIQPTDGSKVKVSFTSAKVANRNLETNVYHVTEENGELSAEKLDIQEKGTTATAETDSFSYYQVEFTYDEMEYVLPGNESVPLSTILQEVGLSGTASKVEVSDSTLFSAEKIDGQWIVSALQPFTSTEWMIVTISGIEYEIAVTDAIEERIVTFDSDNGENPKQDTVLSGNPISKPDPDPQKAGFVFDGWYLDESEFDFSTPITQNITLTAKWIDAIPVIFEYEGQTESIIVGSGKCIPSADIPRPTKQNFVIVGWEYNGAAFDFATPITESITLTPIWETDEWIATYGDQTGKTITVGNSEELTKIYFDTEENAYIIKFTITAPLTVTEQTIGNVRFSFNGTSWYPVSSFDPELQNNHYVINVSKPIPNNQLVETASRADEAERKINTVYYFAWEGQEENAQVITLSIIPRNIELINGETRELKILDWKQIHTVTFDSNEGTAIDPATVDISDGDSVTAPTAIPTKDNYVFRAWQLNGADYDFATPVTEDITLVAAYDAAVASITTGDETVYYASLAAAAAAAEAGDTINVYPLDAEIPADTVIPAGVTIKGAGADQTTLKITTTNGDGLKITNPNVTISNLTLDGSAITSGGYKSLVNVRADGCVIDGITTTGGGMSTWNSSILVETLSASNTFTVRNSNITGSFRGVLRESCSANIVVDNCEIDAIYPINVDGGNGGTIAVTGSKLHGWTSYSGVEKVIFTNCEFSMGNSGYDNVAAYVDTEFNNCAFDSAFKLYAQTSPFTFTLNDCTKDGVTVARDTFNDQFPDDPDVWEKCDTVVNGKLVGAVAEIAGEETTAEYRTLQAAIDAAHEMTGSVTVTLIADITEVAIIHQKAGLDLTVDGDGKTIT
ncbi:MAG: InlB B-repeat-containing protein, partial [Clostridia bacterium]|nr:InlB B-repeat-containing protein [Clostridia bacterium]